MLHKLMKIILTLGIFSLGLLALPHSAQAAGVNFTVERIASNQQNDSTVSYFDLKLKPNQTTEVKVKVTNLSNKEIHLIASPNTGYTTDGGAVAYDLKTLGKKSSAPYQLETIMGGQQKITIPASSKKIVTFPIKMPATPFKGVLDGAIYFLNPKTSQATTTNKKNFTIKSRFALALGVTIHEDTKTIVSPKLTLGTITTGTDQGDKFSPAFKAQIVNNRAVLVKNLQIKSAVSKNGRSLYKTNTKNLTMAADSNFNYAITTHHAALKAGTYHLHLVAKSGSQKWTLNRTFTVSKDQAAKANKHAHIKKSYTLWIVLAVLLILLLLILAYWLGRRGSKKVQK